MQGLLFEVLEPIVRSTPECEAIYAPDGRILRAGDTIRLPELGDLLDRLGAEGPGFLYEGELADRITGWVLERGGLLTSRGPAPLPGGGARRPHGWASAAARCSPTRRPRPAAS